MVAKPVSPEDDRDRGGELVITGGSRAQAFTATYGEGGTIDVDVSGLPAASQIGDSAEAVRAMRTVLARDAQLLGLVGVRDGED